MTIDVEDYFQVSAFERFVSRSDWDTMAVRVEANTDRILLMLDDANVKATFFTLGWVASRFPALMGRIAAEGHEIASHGWYHTRVTHMSPDEFREDVARTRTSLEDIVGQRVIGYRAPSYSFNENTSWAHDILAETGHLYSSSVAPVRHDLYGMPDAPRFVHPVCDGALLEIPITTAVIGGQNRMCAGGGWFRLYPYALSRYLMARVNRKESSSCVFYFHPWEIDPDQPRIAGLDSRTRFRHYLNLRRMESRIKTLLRDFSWGRMDDVFADELATVRVAADAVAISPPVVLDQADDSTRQG